HPTDVAVRICAERSSGGTLSLSCSCKDLHLPMAAGGSSMRSLVTAALAAGLVLLSAVGAAAQSSSPAATAMATPSAGWSDELTGEPDRLDIATTVAPISSIVRNIGGDR